VRRATVDGTRMLLVFVSISLHSPLAQAALMDKKRMTRLAPLCDDLEDRCPQPAFTVGLNVKSINLWYGRGNKSVTAHPSAWPHLSQFARHVLIEPWSMLGMW
jgi:hypothetical protein